MSEYSEKTIHLTWEGKGGFFFLIDGNGEWNLNFKVLNMEEHTTELLEEWWGKLHSVWMVYRWIEINVEEYWWNWINSSWVNNVVVTTCMHN